MTPKELEMVKRLVKHGNGVMQTLEKWGPSIVPHLMDTDDNEGQELREAIMDAEAFLSQQSVERDMTPEEALEEAKRRWGQVNAVAVECYLSYWKDGENIAVPARYKVHGFYQFQSGEGNSFREAFASADKKEEGK